MSKSIPHGTIWMHVAMVGEPGPPQRCLETINSSNTIRSGARGTNPCKTPKPKREAVVKLRNGSFPK